MSRKMTKRMTTAVMNKHIFIMRVNKRKLKIKKLSTIGLNVRASYNAKLGKPKLFIEIDVEAIDVYRKQKTVIE